LGGLGQQFVGISSPEYEGEYLASSVTSLSADGVAVYYAGKQAFLRQKISRSVREDLTGRLIYDNRTLAASANTFMCGSFRVVSSFAAMPVIRCRAGAAAAL